MQTRQTSTAAWPWRRNLVAVAVGTALIGALTLVQPGPAAVAAVNPAPPTALVSHPGFADVVSAVRDSVVTVSVEAHVEPGRGARGLPPGLPVPEWFRRRFATPERGRETPLVQGAGSGFVIDPSGLIVTNHHVIDGAERITVTLSDGRILEARLRGSDEKTDLALIEVDTDVPLAAVQFGDSDTTRVGDWVVAVGNPFGLGGTVTAGIVSARGRDIGAGPFDDFIQMDAPINRGNSGGPLFDSVGRVVGINSVIFSPSGGNVGIGFAIPSRLAEPVIAALRDHGAVSRGWLGVQIQPVDEEMAAALGLDEPRGALVNEVMPDSPAARAGIAVGDVVLSFGDTPIAAFKDLPRLVAGAADGSRAVVEVWRDGARERLEVAVGHPEASPSAPVVAAGALDPDQPRLGVALAAAQGERGAVVVIQAVEPGSPAARSGLEPGDVILRIAGSDVRAPQGVVDAVREAADAKRPLLMLVERHNVKRFLAVDLAKHG